MLHLRRDLPHGGLPCVQSSGAMLVVARLAESWLLLGSEVLSELGGLVVGRARECDYSANAMSPDAVRLQKIWSGNCIPIWATRPDYEHLVRPLPMKQAKPYPPPHTNKTNHTKSFLSRYVLFFDAQPHHSGGGSLSMPGIPWCPLVAPTVDAPQASASNTTHLKLFLGPVGAC